MAPRLARCPASREHPPRSLLSRRRQADGLGGAGGGRDGDGDGARLERLADRVADVGVDRHGLSGLGLLGGIEEPHPLPLGHRAPVGHPAHHLPPKAVVVFVLDPLSPPPGAIGGHEEDLSGPERARDKEGNPPRLVGNVVVDSEDLAAGLGPGNGAIPLKAGERLPHGRILVGGVGETREQARTPLVGERESPRRRRAGSLGAGLVEDHREEIAERRLRKRHLMPQPARHEDEPRGLIFDELLEKPAVVLGELTGIDSDVAEEDDIERRQLLDRPGKLLDCILRAAADLRQPGLKEETGKLDAGIAGEGVAEVAVFPPRHALDEEDAELLLADRHRHRAGVVVGEELAGLRGNADGERVITDGGRRPENPIGRRLHRREAHFLREALAVGGLNLDSHHLLPRQRAADRKRHPKRLGDNAGDGAIDARDGDIRERSEASGGDGKHRHPGEPQARRRLNRRLPLVPVAVGGDHHAAQIRVTPHHRIERVKEVCPRGRSFCIDGLGARKWLDGDRIPILEGAPERPLAERRHRLSPRQCPGAVPAVTGIAPADIDRFHAPRIVEEDSDRRLVDGALFGDPLRLIEEDRDQHRDEQSQPFEEPEARLESAPPPADQADRGHEKHQHDRHPERPGARLEADAVRERNHLGGSRHSIASRADRAATPGETCGSDSSPSAARASNSATRHGRHTSSTRLPRPPACCSNRLSDSP